MRSLKKLVEVYEKNFLNTETITKVLAGRVKRRLIEIPSCIN